MKEFNSMAIFAKRWFDRVNGNTYHSVSISIDGQEEIKRNYEYGYDEQWKNTAWEMLVNTGYASGDYQGYQSFNLLDHNDKFGKLKRIYLFCSDVTRKKDL